LPSTNPWKSTKSTDRPPRESSLSAALPAESAGRNLNFFSLDGNFPLSTRVPYSDSGSNKLRATGAPKKEQTMGGEIIGLAAVIMSLGIPLGGLYTYYRVRKLRTEERLAAIARGVAIPMEPELSQAARSRRSGILLISGALGYIVTFGIIARVVSEPDTWAAAAFGIIPLAVGLGYFLDSTLIRRDLRAAG
jgi:hypothetical protein